MATFKGRRPRKSHADRSSGYRACGRPMLRKLMVGLLLGAAGLLVVGLMGVAWIDPAVFLHLDPNDIDAVAQRFFINECGGHLERLTHWNAGERFISLGILHMIWYPSGVPHTFQESFPDFVRFCQTRSQPPPAWLVKQLVAGCPWRQRQGFYQAFESEKAISLRRFLRKSISLQVQFAFQRLATSLDPITAASSLPRRLQVKTKLFFLARSRRGLFAMIDYVNFKGEGLNPKERYNGFGWGLRQVIETMRTPFNSRQALDDFVVAAESVLERRISHAPNPALEGKWLPGWKKRIKSYRD